LLVLGAVAGCATNPVTGAQEIGFVSEERELEIGAESYPTARQAQGGDYKIDPELTRYVRDVGQRLAVVSDRRLPYEFVVLNSSVPNAWALPGGKIAVNRGLLTELRNEAELAAVLAHEIVHAAARHGAKAIERGTLLQVGVLAVGIAAANSEYGTLIALGSGLAASLVNLRYSREAELESDQYGMVYMARAGYDPRAAISLQETFVRLSEGRSESWLGGLFASHPPSRERIETNRATAARLAAGGELGEERYRQKTAHLARTRPAYQSFDEGRKALEQNDPQGALGLVRRAIEIEPREALFYGLWGDVLARQRERREAIARYDDALARDDGYFYYYLRRGLVRGQLGDRPGMQQDLERSQRLLPTGVAASALGRLALESGNRPLAVQYYRQAAGAGGEIGREATRVLARLEPGDPNRYLQTRLSRDDKGTVWATMRNTGPVDVRDIEVVARYRDDKGRVWRYATTLSLIRAGSLQTFPMSFGSSVPSDKALGRVELRVERVRIPE
jgi:predicted Zn-dependent protease